MAAAGYIPTQTLRRLFEEASGEVAVAAAIGHWSAHPRGEVERELEATWRQVVLRAPALSARASFPSSTAFWLGEILESSPDLALEWLRTAVVGGEQSRLFRQFGLDFTARALKALSAGQRIAVLDDLSREAASSGLVRDLVDDDPAIFRALLSRPDLREVHLVSLRRLPDDTWWELAKVAVVAGKRPREVAEAAFGLSGASFLHDGPGAAVTFFDGRVIAEAAMRGLAAFESRLKSADPDLAAIALEGRDIAAQEVERATSLDRQFGIQGL
jgi:hypothetical protein